MHSTRHPVCCQCPFAMWLHQSPDDRQSIDRFVFPGRLAVCRRAMAAAHRYTQHNRNAIDGLWNRRKCVAFADWSGPQCIWNVVGPLEHNQRWYPTNSSRVRLAAKPTSERSSTINTFYYIDWRQMWLMTLTVISDTSGRKIFWWNSFGISWRKIGTASARPSATALRTLPPMKNDTDRKCLASSGSVYSAPPSVCIEHVWTFRRSACFPWTASAFTRRVGVAAAPWMNTVSPANT